MATNRRRPAGGTTDFRASEMPPPIATSRRPTKRVWRKSALIGLGLLVAVGIWLIATRLRTPQQTILSSRGGRYRRQHFIKVTEQEERAQASLEADVEVLGHADFDDGRKRAVKRAFVEPASEALQYVNVMLGNGGPEPDLSGGMIPAVAPPFAMTRWTPQTRQHYVSMCPYNQTDAKLMGFLGTHQPAIWMGESGPAQISAGLGAVVTDSEARALPFRKEDEYASANYYRTIVDAGEGGSIEAELTGSERVGHLRFSFSPSSAAAPHVVVQASRPSVLLNAENTGRRDPSNVTYPHGWIRIDPARQEVSGWNDERQDRILLSEEISAKTFRGYFVARFSEGFDAYGTSNHGQLRHDSSMGEGEVLAGYVTFPHETPVVDVRVGVSFISIEQARRNIDLEVPEVQTLEETSRLTRQAWSDKLDALIVSGATTHNLTVLYTSYAHTLVYPYTISENTGTAASPIWSYYSGYLDRVMQGVSYSGYSIWDTFRAQTAWMLLVAPDLVGGMITSMLQDWQEGGWLPMWKSLVETNIMVGTHADSVIAQAMQAGVTDFDWDLAWQAVRKNAFTPPDRDAELRFEDREEHTPQEVRAGLTEYMGLGYVAADLHDSEAGSRTLDYAYDDHAAATVASHVGTEQDARLLRARSRNYKHMWNSETGFMEARNEDGSWAGERTGWTEGDHWAYSLNVMHDIPGLIDLMGGNRSFVAFLDKHFEEGHNLHANEPSHHIPYLYALAGAPHKAQEWIRRIGENEYNHTAGGLSGNEDCGQMSAWYLFSAVAFYPVDPASAVYVIGAPFFDCLTLSLPGAAKPIVVQAFGANDGRRYVRSVRVDGEDWTNVFLPHERIEDGAEIVFEMSDTPQMW